MLINFFPIGHGAFGFNGNIFETNIINLAAVVGIVVTFVGGGLTTLLDDRKKTIINNLQEANKRAIEAQEKLSQARTQLESAKKKSEEIRAEGILRATQEINNCETQHGIRLARLQEFKQETLQQAEGKAFKQAYMYLIPKITKRAAEKADTRLNSISQNTIFHKTVNIFNASRIANSPVKSILSND